MRNMETESKVEVLDLEEEYANVNIKVRNHWNRSTLVRIEINGEEYTVSATELKKAIENATNVEVIQ